RSSIRSRSRTRAPGYSVHLTRSSRNTRAARTTSMPRIWALDPGRSVRTARVVTSIRRRCLHRFHARRIRQNSGVSSEPTVSWKDRYAALEARRADTKAALDQTRKALQSAQERDQATRATLAKVRDRLHWHERSLLRPEVLNDLLPARAQWRRQTPPDDEAVRRETLHTGRSEAYAAARDQAAPA